MVTARPAWSAARPLLLFLLLCLLTSACRSTEPPQREQPRQTEYTIDQDGERVTQVVAAGDQTCVLTAEGGIYCWGGRGWGPSFIRDIRKALAHTWGPERRAVQISVGRTSGCVIDDRGALRCWLPIDGKLRVEPPERSLPSGYSLPVEAIAIGDEARCFVGNDGAAACGIRGFRRAPGGFHSHYSPVRASLVTYRTLDAGAFHVCGVTDDFELYCWGHNGAGQTDVPEGQFESVSGGQWHSCAIDINDMLSCWGENAYGQSAPPAGSFRAVDAGGRHTCAIATDQQLHCWGDNSHKQSQPPPGEWVAVSSGDEHSCAISVDKALACWGSNEYGQTDIPGGKWVQVDVGAFEDWGTEFCALREDGVVSCANNLQTYALYGFWDGRTVDVPKAPVGRWMALDLGSNQRCLQDESQQVQCWRWNERHGQVTEYLAPIPPNPAGYRKFSAGGRYVCLIDEEQRLSCVRSSGGWNRDHADEHDPHPVTILPGRYTDLAVGSHHVCAIDQVGDVECVHLDKGINQSLMPDLPPMPNLSEPVAAVSVDPHEWRECATNQVPECPDAPACLLTKSGRVLCWGRGSGDRWDIGATPSITQIGVGCGLDNAGKIHCWDDTKTHLGQATGPFTSLGSSGASHCATTVSGNIHCWGSIGFVIENRELTHGSFLIPGVKIAAVRPGPDRLPPPRAERVDDH